MNSDPPSESVDATLSAAEQALIDGSADAPHALLGLHPCGHANRLVVFLPDAVSVQLYPDLALRRYGERGLFFREQVVEAPPYRLLWQDRHGHHRDTCDPYSLPLQLQQRDLTSLTQGCLWNAPDILGAHRHTVAGLPGVLFAVWAPDARRVSVVGDFNGWNGVCHPMHRHAASGVWELFIPGLEPGALYKFEIRPTQGSQLLLKADPWGQGMERPPASASVVPDRRAHEWRDTTWMASRATRDWLHTPLSIYEVHLGSWRRGPDGRLLSYRELAPSLAAYAAAQGFTHIEFLPLMEHPFDGSWGYQITGYFAPTRRYGSADDLRYLVDYCHSQGLGVLLDWVPGHFACDSYALAHFDGTALYEHADPRLGVHPDWGTLVFNLGRPEVRNFLIANALYWLESFHVDGLRVDAVASMLYRDYSRPEGAWLPNAYGGRENLEAVAFLRELNHTVLTRHSDVLMIAEESTAWPAVSRPPDHGGLGFSMKWNMGWMHDVLAYMQRPLHDRGAHLDDLTFGIHYAFCENFVLPFSHDEVVHGKRSLLGKMPGDDWQRFANLRLLYTCLYTWPGAKLLFMGNEFAQQHEWSHDRALDWHLLERPDHAGIQALVRDLNQRYRQQRALHASDFSENGFSWIAADQANAVLSYVRRDGAQWLVVVLNFTARVHRNYRIGVPGSGLFKELLNSDSVHYGGSNAGNLGQIQAAPIAAHGHSWSLTLTLPPLAALILQPAVAP